MECGDTFEDPGAGAMDICGGDLTGAIFVGGDTILSNVLGAYTLTYDVTDSAGNAASQVQRTVTVQDSTAPVITLLGENIVVDCGGVFTDPGVTASDVCDGDLSAQVSIGGQVVDVNTPGVFTITYEVTDSSENVGFRSRTVTVLVV